MSRKRTKNLRSSKAATSVSSGAASAGATPAGEDVDASDPAAAHFFSAPPVTYDEEPAVPVEAEAPVARRVPVSPARRRRLGRVVAGTVTLACAICVAAGVRVATVRAAPPQVSAVREAAQAPLPPAETVSESSPPPPQPEAVPESPPPAPPVVEAPQAPPQAPEATPVVAAPDPVAARDAKRISQRALDRGNTKASIEAGEQSVALDPSDAEAWLILGAAYQARGAYAEGRRCFSTCAQVAKRGPRSECAALLR